MGASAVLVFALLAAPLAQPRAVLLGNFASALFGTAAAQLFPDPLLAGSLGAAGAILAMQPLRCTCQRMNGEVSPATEMRAISG
ncbi:MAG: hypothetical protein BGO57_00525 [Sphingomonadales bacterium 63-6]|nr:MAG: hypothetical protein BGO57_00525 [Sphingomonadales bacterium 63-6]